MSIQVKDSNGNWVRAAGGMSYSIAPIGVIFAYGSDKIPVGYLLCEGQEISRTDYSELFSAIGTAFGSGDGSTTFNVPDLRETVPVGSGTRGNGVTAHDTYTLGQFKDDQLQGHSHIPENYRYDVYRSGGGNYNGGGYGDHLTNDHYSDGTNGTPRTGTTTHGKQLGVNYIIKANRLVFLLTLHLWMLSKTGI